ncbi:MAG: threonine-phosphate decarboxylase CobD [Limnospira sp.]
MSRPEHGGNLSWAATVANCPASEILDFSASINPLGPPQSAIAAIETHMGHIQAYPQPDYRELREALAQFHALPDPDWILPGNGAAELLTWGGRELAETAATYLLTPAFGDYRRSLQAFDARIVDNPIWQNGQIRPLSELGAAPKSAGLLINTPHNPTGYLFSRESIRPLLERFALVLVDEAFMDFLPPAEQQSLIAEVANFPNLVILRSLTKFYSLPGLRLGYAIAHPERLQRWQEWRDPWSVNVLAAAAGIAVLGDRDFEAQTRTWLKVARPQLYRGLKELPGLDPHPGAANFLLVYSQWPVAELQAQLLREHRILIRDCLSFPELGDRYFRVAVRTEAENRRLLDALARCCA